MESTETISTRAPVCPRSQCAGPRDEVGYFPTGIENTKRYLTLEEVAKYLGVSRWTVYNLVNHRKMPFIALSKRTFRFDRLKIDKWMEKQEVKTLKDLV